MRGRCVSRRREHINRWKTEGHWYAALPYRHISVQIWASREHQEHPFCPSYPHTHYLCVSRAPARSSGMCTCASPLGHFAGFQALSTLLQFLELSDIVYRQCIYPRQPQVNARVPPPLFPLVQNPLRSSVSLSFTSGVCCMRPRP
jgi:hypothetical protein